MMEVHSEISARMNFFVIRNSLESIKLNLLRYNTRSFLNNESSLVYQKHKISLHLSILSMS